MFVKFLFLRGVQIILQKDGLFQSLILEINMNIISDYNKKEPQFATLFKIKHVSDCY